MKREKLKFIIKISYALYTSTLPLGILAVKEQEEAARKSSGWVCSLPHPRRASLGLTFSLKQTFYSFPLAQRKITKDSMMASAFKEKECYIYRHEALAHIASCPVYFSMPAPHLD